jgi:hypothetical protein
MPLSRPILIFVYLLKYPTMYLPLKYGLSPLLRLFGCKRTIVGTCVILAPPKQMLIILQGIEYLRTLDSEMYQRLTAERRYVFWYNTAGRYLRILDIFSITDSFLLWGKEGVVTCFVQSVIGSALEQSPFKRSKITDRQARQQLFEWLSKHSFSPELVKHYQEFAEK